ncbi:MAG: sugar ABC transporter substrate-binding protein [Clostridia bacterium]
MKSRKLRGISILMIAIMIMGFTFSACTQNTLTDTYVLGSNNFFKGAPSLDILEKFATYTAVDAYGNEFIVLNDEAQPEKLVQNVEYQIASGVDGLVLFGIIDAIIPTISAKCLEAKVPFVLYDHMPPADMLADLKENPYFVGIVGEKDYEAGYPQGEFLIEKGCKKALILTGTKGDPCHEARTQGFTDAFTAGGGTVIDVGWTDATLANGLTAIEDLLTAHPDADCIYASSGDLIAASMQALAARSNTTVKIVGTDLDATGLQGLRDGKVEAINGAHWINSGFSVALLQNYLDGHQLLDKDGKAPVLYVPIIVLPKEQADLYDKFWNEQLPYTVEEMQAVAYRWNKDVTAESIQQILDEYSISERLLQRYEEGKVTAEELEAVGISVK